MIIHSLIAYGNKANIILWFESFLAAENRSAHIRIRCMPSVRRFYCFAHECSVVTNTCETMNCTRFVMGWLWNKNLRWWIFSAAAEDLLPWKWVRVCVPQRAFMFYCTCTYTPNRNEFDDKFTEMETYSIDRQI